MEILGGGQPEGPRPGDRNGIEPAEEVLSEAELQGLADLDEGAADDEPRSRPGPSGEALAIASALLALPTVTGSAWFYGGALTSSSAFNSLPELSELVKSTSGMWAPGLVALAFAALSRRALGTTRSWARSLADGSALATLAMMALIVLGVLYNQSFVEVPEDQF